MLIIWLITLIFIKSICGNLDSCFSAGICVNSQFLKSVQTENYEICWKACHENPDCHWIVFNPNEKMCHEFESCEETEVDDLCQDCFVASEFCPSKLQVPCKLSGQCQGVLISSVFASMQGMMYRLFLNQFTNGHRFLVYQFWCLYHTPPLSDNRSPWP